MPAVDLTPEAGAPTFDVLVRGQPSVDLTFLGLPQLPRMGEEYQVSGFSMSPGATYNNVNAMARLGLRTGYATDIGNDFFGRYITESLRAAHINESFIRYHDMDLTVLSVGLSFQDDRTFITWVANKSLQERGVLLEDLHHNRVRCLFNHGPFQPEIVEETRRQQIPIVLDTAWDPDYLVSTRQREAIDQAAAFMPNLPEAMRITGTRDAGAALSALSELVPIAVIKLGPDGAIARTHGRTYHVPALKVDVVDTTGAGDNFAAGMVYGLLHDLPFERMLRCAVAAGSLSTRCAGGVQGSPTEAEMLEGVAELERVSAR